MKALLGESLRVLHFVLALFAVLATLAGPTTWSPYLLLLWTLVIVANLMCGGCPATRVEKYLTGKDVTVVDPYLHAMGLDSTHRNRFGFTFAVALSMVGVVSVRWWGEKTSAA